VLGIGLLAFVGRDRAAATPRPRWDHAGSS